MIKDEIEEIERFNRQAQEAFNNANAFSNDF